MSLSLTSSRIITFYSWKGGVGRTMALANVAVQLARQGYRVLAVDWDLEAPGLDRYFLVGEGAPKLEVVPPADPSGLLGVLTDAMAAGNAEPDVKAWQARLHHIKVPPAETKASQPISPTPGDLHLLSSGLGTPGYGERVADFSWPDFFAKARGGEWLEKLRGQWKEAYDFVLIDSRTGLTDSGGVCTVQMPDMLVLVFTSNEQSLEDGLKFVESVQRSRSRFAYDRSPLAVLPLLSRWGGDDEVDLGVQWLERMDAALKPVTSSWLPIAFSPRQFLEKVRVPHVARFSFGEPLPVITHSLTDSNLPGLAYETVSVLLATNLAAVARFIDPSYEPPRYSAGYQKAADLNQLALVQDSITLHQEIARLSKIHGSKSNELSIFLGNAAQKLYTIGRFAEAEPLMRRALALDEARLGSDHPNVAIHLSDLAQLLRETNRLVEAEPLMRRALAMDEASFGSDHPDVAIDLNNLAQLLLNTNRLAEAEPLMRRALAIGEASFGSDHPNVSIALNNLAQLLQDTNRLAEAEPLMRRALAMDEASFGSDHPNVARNLNNLAQLLQTTNRLAEAEPLMRRALAIDEASFGSDHPNVATRLNNLAHLLQATNRLAEAEPLIRRALAIDEASFGSDHPKIATRLNNLAQLLQATNRLAEAEPLMRRALAIDEASFGSDHPNVALRLNNLARLLQDTNRLAEAEPLMRRALAIAQQGLVTSHPDLRVYEENYRLLLEGIDEGGEEGNTH